MKKTTLFVLLIMILSSISFGQESLLNSKSKHFTKTAATPLVEQSARKVYPEMLNKTTKNTIFYEGFETSPNPSEGLLPEGWTQKRTSTLDETPITDPDPTSQKWFRHEPGVFGFSTGDYVYNGNASMAISFNAPQFTWAISPEFTITGNEGETVFLSYYKWYTNAGSSGVFPTSYHVKVFANGAWSLIQSFIGTPETPNNNWDEQVALDISSYLGETIKIAFVYEYTDGYQMAIDDIDVSVAPDYDLGIASVEYERYQWWPASVGKQMYFDVAVNGLGLTPVVGSVTMFVNDQEIANEVLGPMAFGMSDVAEFTWTPGAPGDYIIRFQLSDNLNDGIGSTYPDENPDNNFIELALNVPEPELVRFTEGFEHVDWDNPNGATAIFPPSNEWIFTPKWGVTTTRAMRDLISASVFQFNGDEPEVLVTPGMYLPAGDVNIQLIVGGLNNGLTVDGSYLGHSTLEIYLLDAEPNSKDDVKSTLLYTHSLESGDTPTPVSIDATLDTEGTYYIQFQTTSTFNSVGFMSGVFLDNIMVMSYQHTITTTAGDNGTIEPTGIVFVKEGTSKIFSITPNTGFIIEDVLVNNESVGAVSNYTFENVTDSHTIHATFAPDPALTFYAFSQPFSFNTTPKLSLISYSGLFTFNTTAYIDTTSVVVYTGLFAFDTRRFTVNAVASPVTGGNVGGQGNYVSQQTVNLFAQPNQGYNFVNWTEDGNIVSAVAEYSFIANADRELIAHFEENEPVLYTLTLEASPNVGGTVSGAGAFEAGSQLLLAATAAANYTFDYWAAANGTVISEEAIFQFVMPANDDTLTAHFTETLLPDYYTLNLYSLPYNNAGGGAFGGGQYLSGSEVTIIASPNMNFSFTGWRDEQQNMVSTDEEYTFTLLNNMTLIAVFDGQSYQISTQSNIEHGTTLGNGVYYHQQIAQVQALPNENYRFLRWMEGDIQRSVLQNYLFSATADQTLYAEFIPDWSAKKDNNSLIIANAHPNHIGVVLNQGYHTNGQTITLTASPNNGLDFVKWTENGIDIKDENGNLIGMEYSFEVNGDRELVAIFGGNTYQVSTTSYPENAGELSGAGAYYYGDYAVVEVLSHEDYNFYSWTSNNQQLSVNKQFGFTVMEDRAMVANFAVPVATYSLILLTNPENAGTVSGNGSYASGESIDLNATANDGYKFLHWADSDGTQLSTDAQYTYTMPGAETTLVAHFTETTHVDRLADTSIQVFPNPARNYSVVVAGTVMHNITLSDITGKKIQDIMVKDTQAHIATESLEGGIYFLHIHTEAGTIVRKLQVIK